MRERIIAAAARAGRSPDEITLVGVSKRHSAESVRAAWAAGVREFGENYVQEARDKCAQLSDLSELRWHLIGSLQSNKARLAVSLFEMVQTVDRLSLAQALSRAAVERQKELSVLVEVNLAGSANRAGVAEAEALALCEQVSALPNLRLCGFMGMAPLCADAEATRPHFARLRQLFEGLPDAQRQVLSMGMSGDFEAAIAEGATLVRIGTALFGQRPSVV
ncbi:YggS family pyridoxal phosphate-dependent enzyme [Armatimonas sp.]|uniref:YggS family pyridoxal phosphate-dependent enzyme n=1 Tax=Armatimonas sp. TaxID=1872638 RepID=UPI00374CEF8C